MSLTAQACAAQLQAQFQTAGAQPVDCPVLLPADTLLDLYGEDIRARAYVTNDPSVGEMMLRPDFTVPVVQRHMQSGATPARYTYAGTVFRRQEDDARRASEYLQVGFELFDDANPAQADAEVFALFTRVLAPYGLEPVTGDMGILTAAIAGLNTSARRKTALMRHVWRPRRFRALLDRFGGKSPMPPSRAALLAQDDPIASEPAPMIGLRSRTEIAERIDALRADAAEPPLPADQLDLIDALLAIRETAPYALSRLNDIAVDLPAMRPAVTRMQARLEALAAQGIDTDALAFEATYGRTSMEYYDGFVFGFVQPSRPDLPAVASGGRYDALTSRLGDGQSIAAIGGVIRPDLLVTDEDASWG